MIRTDSTKRFSSWQSSLYRHARLAGYKKKGRKNFKCSNINNSDSDLYCCDEGNGQCASIVTTRKSKLLFLCAGSLLLGGDVVFFIELCDWFQRKTKPTTKLERIFTRYVGYIEPTADGSHPSFLSLRIEVHCRNENKQSKRFRAPVVVGSVLLFSVITHTFPRVEENVEDI